MTVLQTWLDDCRGTSQNEQLLAMYRHCGPHCVNLVTQAACEASPLVRDSMSLVHELGGLFNQSGKFKVIFQEVAKSKHGFD